MGFNDRLVDDGLQGPGFSSSRELDDVCEHCIADEALARVLSRYDDPPYIPAGGKTTTTAGDFQANYGIREGRNQDQLQTLVFAGLAETARVMDSYLLVKCMDYVNGGRFTPMSYLIAQRAGALGLAMHDEIIHHAGSGPGGHNIVTPKRARRHHSKLLVFTHA